MAWWLWGCPLPPYQPPFGLLVFLPKKIKKSELFQLHGMEKSEAINQHLDYCGRGPADAAGRLLFRLFVKRAFHLRLAGLAGLQG